MHAAAGQQSDALVASEPADGLRYVARVRVLRRDQDERAAELLVQRGEQQRQRGLGHARSRRERLGEGAQALALAEGSDEWVKDRLVHDERPNPGGSARSSYRGA